MSRSKQIDMSEVRFAAELRIGNIRLAKANTLPLAETFVDISAGEVSITFWGDTPAPWDDISLASIRMFRLPRGRAEFQRQIEWFSDKRKQRARLPEGVPFDEHTLALRNVPESWKHTAFARSGRDFIHIYESKQQAILIRLLGKAGTILDNPLLKRIHRNLSIAEQQWIAKFPVTERRTRTSRTRDTRLAADVKMEMQGAAARARTLLNLDRIRDPKKTAEAIHRSLDEVRSRKRLGAEAKKRLAIDYGVLWGNALCEAAQWEWCCVKTAGQETYAVTSENRSHAVDPIGVMHQVLSSRRAANNSLLLFNMIVSGDLPQSPAHAYCWLT